MRKILFILFVVAGVVFINGYRHIFLVKTSDQTVTFDVAQGENVSAIGRRLEEQEIITSDWFFRTYIGWKNLDTKIHFGSFTVDPPITMVRVIDALTQPSTVERTITILPGWNLFDIAEYLEKQGIASQEEFFSLTGRPGVFGTKVNFDSDIPLLDFKPDKVSLEGYFRPDTFRVYKNATAAEIIERLIREREKQLSDELRLAIASSGHSFHEVLTLASILEREVRSSEDRKIVADIFWRRYDIGWALQADSTVHYLTGKTGNVFTSQKDRDSESLWNTYKHPGLPPGPISNPSLDAIEAAVYPTKNSYWYFLTTLDTGEVKYAKTLEEHNANAAKYLR